jgi:hypothetical protein
MAGRLAAARLAYTHEITDVDTAESGHETLLLKQQMGILAEFARQRLRILRSGR